jgi:hypothetical protein
MTATELSTAIQVLLSLIVFVIVLFSLWPRQRVDLFRQQMFALRDELFDFALNENIDFNNPAYNHLRALMNGFIRYAHNLTAYRTLMLFLRWKCTSSEQITGWSASWDRVLSNVESKDTKTKLEEFRSKASMLVVSQIILSPTLLVILFPTLLLTTMLYLQWTSLRTIFVDVNAKIPMALLEEEAANS